MRKSKKRRFSKKEQFSFVLQSLRYALANRIPLFRVVETQTKPFAAPEYPSVEIIIEVYGLPEGERGRVKRPVSPRRISEFFRDWKIQEDFLKWYAKRIASTIPADSSLARLKRSLARLAVGRHGKLPPKIDLQSQYRTLIAEIMLLHLRFGNHVRLPQQRGEILNFGIDNNAKWVQFCKKYRIFLGELFDVTPQTAAKLMLSKQYGCREGSIHDRLFRKVSQ
jgi:hypothetical protein